MNRFTVVGLGEALFDLLPGREVLGGAPLNAIVHVHQLGAAHGFEAVMVSRVGADERGQRIRQELAARGLSDDFIQTDPEFPTGTVRVELEQGEPRYDIVRDVAWDRLDFAPDLQDLAERCQAVCFGTIYRFLDAAPDAIRLFDVNLRQHYFDADVLRESLKRATFAKMNQAELRVVVDTLGLATEKAENEADQLEELARVLRTEFTLAAVILTRGARGAVLYTVEGSWEVPPTRYRAAPDADHVGAGDAFTAALLVGMALDWEPFDTLVLGTGE
jgi:fructokinase